MPYNIPQEIGGDSQENTRWMEECIKQVMEHGKEKDQAIAICKSTLIKVKGKKQEASFIINFILKNSEE